MNLKEKSSTVLPPEIIQHFNKKLLSIGIRLTPHQIIKLYRRDVLRKYNYQNDWFTRKKIEYEKYLGIYGAIYGWLEAQEAYDRAENKEKQERPPVPFEILNRIDGKLGKNVRGAFISWDSSNFRQDNGFPEIQKVRRD